MCIVAKIAAARGEKARRIERNRARDVDHGIADGGSVAGAHTRGEKEKETHWIRR